MTSIGFIMGYLNLIMIFGILSTISALSSFGSQKLIFWRESSYGISISAFWCSRMVVDFFFIFIQTLVWSSILYGYITPSYSTYAFFSMWLGQAFANSGVGYVLSTIIPSRNLTLYAAMVTALGGLFLSGVSDGLMYIDAKVAIVNNPNTSFTKRLLLSFMDVTYSRWMIDLLSVSKYFVCSFKFCC
jgi:hypothetical protein|tara:strand:+ start:365 stop:925 length:561 start_codon:yes stop_codon:yes gene_type:complete